jgi:four helix bundle protein
MAIQKFEDILAWQKGQDLAAEIYQLFQNSRDFGFKDQITRAAVSISNNIAEGFERGSNADFSRFLYFSLGSCSEVKSMVYLAEKLKYLSIIQRDQIISQATEINKIIYGLIKSMIPRK